MREPILQNFLPLMRNAVIATIGSDGGPEQTAAMVYYDGRFFCFRTTVDSPELASLQRDSNISICIQEPGGFGRWMTVRGRCIERREQRDQGVVWVRVAPENEEDAKRTA